jgi:hypothetical protein
VQVLSSEGSQPREVPLRRLLLLSAVALVAALVLAPAAVAKQHKDDASATAGATASATAGSDLMTASPTADSTATATASGGATAAVGGALPSTGGSGLALIAGALLLGSGVLSYAILRRSP